MSRVVRSDLVLDPTLKPSLGPLLELLGLLLSLGAWLLALGATVGPWMRLQGELGVERVELGLWAACVVQDSLSVCRPHSSLLALPWNLLLGRGLMGLALALGLGAVGATVLGLSVVQLKCLTAVHRCDLKRALRLLGAVLCLVAATMEAVPVSYAGYVTVQRFFETSASVAAPRWDLGDALFCGWASAVIHLLSAVTLGTSCRSGVTGAMGGGARQEYI